MVVHHWNQHEHAGGLRATTPGEVCGLKRPIRIMFENVDPPGKMMLRSS